MSISTESRAAIIVAICAVAISVWQGYETRKHNRLSTKPIILYEWEVKEGQKSGIYIQNNGLGPAILTDIEFSYAGKIIQRKDNSKWAIVSKKINRNGGKVIFNYFNPGAAFIPGQKFFFFFVKNYDSKNPKELGDMYSKLGITLSYCSVYGDCFTATLEPTKKEEFLPEN